MALLIGGILIAFGFGMGKVNYVLSPLGVEQNIRRFIPFHLWGKKETRFITWKNISSYKNDTDRTRSGGEYEYLKLYLSISPGEIWITNQHDDKGFQIFKDAFLEMVRNPSSMHVSTEKIVHKGNHDVSSETKPSIHYDHGSVEMQSSGPIQGIKQRKSFYETTIAKVVTLFFAVVTILLVWVLAYKGMRFSSWYRIMFILLPGTVYMIYRVFIGPRITKENPNQYNQ
jgi:hypothetical protein